MGFEVVVLKEQILCVKIQFNSIYFSCNKSEFVNITIKITLKEKKGIGKARQQLSETHSQYVNAKALISRLLATLPP
jgi:hypothetical protein